MNTFVRLVRISGFTGDVVHLYSVLLEGEIKSEYERFVLNHFADPLLRVEFAEIQYFLDQISKQGAFERQFRKEGFAIALPPNLQHAGYKSGRSLRLYGVRLSDKLVVLLSGAVKTARSAQGCPQVLPHFYLAQQVSRAIKAFVRYKSLNITADGNDFDPPDFRLKLKPYFTSPRNSHDARTNDGSSSPEPADPI